MVSIVLIISIVIRLLTLGWSLWLLHRIRDWRIGFMAAMIGLMALRQILTLRMGIESEATELPGLAVSVMILVAVIFLAQLLIRRRQTEKTLRENQRVLSTLISNLPGMAYRCRNDRDWTLEFVSEGCRDLTGYDPSDLIGNRKVSYGQELIHPDDQEFVWEQVQAALRLKQPFQIVYRIVDANQKEKWVWEQGRGIFSPSGDLLAIEGFVADITDRKQAEEKLKTHYRELQALQEINQNILNSLDLQFIIDGILDKTLSVGSFDLGAIRLLDPSGKNLEPVARQGYRDAKVWRNLRIDPISYDSGRTLIRVITEKKTRVVEKIAEFDGLRTFKKEGVQSAIVIPVLAHGQILGTIQLGSRKPRKFDPDEIHLLEAIGSQMGIAVQKARLHKGVKNQAVELERANKVTEEFLSIMSHEIRTPLNTFVGYTEMVRDKMVGEINQKQEEVLGKALDQAVVLLGMINRVLLTTQIDAGMIKVETDEVNLVELLDKLKSTYGIPVAKNVSLQWSYPLDLPRIRTDSNQLNHILQNLINNGLKFTHEGYVTISARHLPGPGIVEFQVSDTGIGIRKESLSAIFGKFRQVDSSETRFYGGVGLGLYIAKHITEKLGGTLEVESEPGTGSTFTLKIPRELSAASC